MKTPSKKTNKLNLYFYPKSLFFELSKVLGSEFDNLPNKIQTGYTNIFWCHNGIIRHNQHNKSPDSFVLGRDEINRNFTDYRDFKAVNSKGYYLRPKSNRYGVIDNQYVLERKETEGAVECQPTNWTIRTTEAYQSYKEGGVVGSKSGYQLAPKIKRLIADWYTKPKEELENPGLVNSKGETIQEVSAKLGGAISKDKSSTPDEVNVNLLIAVDVHSIVHHKKQVETIRRWLEINTQETLRINSEGWKEIQQEALGEKEGGAPSDTRTPGGVNRDAPLQSLISKDITLEGIKQRIIEINTLLAFVREMDGDTVPAIYAEVSTGRYHTKGAVLQGYHKSVRYAALKGCYEYDLEAAHQNILIQLLDKQDKSFPELAVVREYVANKKEVRVRLSKELGTSVGTVKEIIQELTYGAKLNRSPKSSIYKTCNGNKGLLDRVVSNNWLKRLESTFKLAHKYLIGDSQEIVNAVGIKFEKNGKARGLAHILQGYERLVLDTIIKHSNREDIALLVHDCVVFYNKQSTDKLSQIVEQETGLCLAFSEEEY